MFFTDINQEEGLETKSDLASEYGEQNVEFSVQVHSEFTFACFIKLIRTFKDISKEEDWSDIWTKAETFFGGQVEALVNNAGIYGGQGSLDHKVLEVNLIGLVHGTRLARDRMSAENGGQRSHARLLSLSPNSYFRTRRGDCPDGVCGLGGHHEGVQCSAVRGLQARDPGHGEVTRPPHAAEVRTLMIGD